MSSVNAPVYHSITIGAGGYTSPLTVTSSGLVHTYGNTTAILGNVAGNTVINFGTIIGGTAASGVNLQSGSLINNGTGGYIGGDVGISIGGTSRVTVVNGGVVIGESAAGLSVVAGPGGYVSNGTGALIQGAGQGIGFFDTGNSINTVVNAGTIIGTGTSGVGVYIYQGVVRNVGASSLIVGGVGVETYFLHNMTVINAGTIQGTNATAGFGVYLDRGTGTVVNSGTIIGANGTAVAFNGTGTNLVELEGGYKFTGIVQGSTATGAINTIELGSSSTAGTLSTAVPTEFPNFSGLNVDAGAVWTLTGVSTLMGAAATPTITDSGTLTNSGTLVLGGANIFTVNAGSFTNTGSVSGRVTLAGGSYLKNTNRLTATGTAVNGATGTDRVVNTGVISGSTNGVVLSAGGTVTNGGTIIGSSGAVQFVGNFTDRVIVDPGAVFTGNVVGGSGGNTLELASAASTGTLTGIGTQFTNFGTVTVDTGASWVLTGSNTIGAGATLSNAGTLTNNGTLVLGTGAVAATGTVNFGASSELVVSGSSLSTDPTKVIGATLASLAPGDIIDLPNATFAAGGSALVNGSNVLQITDNGKTFDFQLDQAYSGDTFNVVVDGGTGVEVTISVACYCRGTMILTPLGEMAVEDLEIGDMIMTLSGKPRAVRWIGRRAYDGRFIAGNREALPIRIAAGALGDGVPKRDLWVSPGHSLYVDDALIRSEHLINGATIVQAESIEEVEYFHIELDDHDIIVADGAPAETYVDCENRYKFANAAEYATLYPDDDRQNAQFCRPSLQWGSDELAAVRARLLRRAATTFGHALDDDESLHLVVDGTSVYPDAVSGERYRFTIPAGSLDVRLISRTAVPAAIDPHTCDIRVLGVAIDRFVVSDAAMSLEVSHSDPSLADGFHADEDTLRWTNGDARLPETLLAPFANGCVLEVHLIATDIRYWQLAAAA